MRILIKNILINIAITCVLLTALEMGLRWLWVNPYLLQNEHQQYTRFHPAGLKIDGVVKQLYQGNHLINFQVKQDLSLSDGLTETHESVNIAIGGSTTECGLVPEGERWTDLLNKRTLNYGVSGNSSIDGFHNLVYLNEVQRKKINNVIVMFAINDLRAYLTKGEKPFNLTEWREPLANIADSIDNASRTISESIRLKDSYILSFVNYNLASFKGRDFFTGSLNRKKEQDIIGSLSEQEFEGFKNNFIKNFLPKKWTILKEYYRYTKQHKLKLTLLTQPHAYSLNYQATNTDLRLYPIFDGKKMTNNQSIQIMDLLNNQTRQFATEHDLTLIDVEMCLKSHSPSKIFYDAVHYTLEGSRAFSRCVNQ